MGGMALAAVSATKGIKKAEAEKTKGKRYAMAIDLRKCFGCHACSVACKSQFDVPLGVWRSWVKIMERGKYPNVKRIFIPVLCNHCEKPPCVKGCPTGATYQRDDGIVVVNEADCIGCKYCIQNCAYQARFLHPFKKVANKCDFCIHRVEQGLVPACVNTCNAKARIFGDINDPETEISRLLMSNNSQVLMEGIGTMPQVYYIDLVQNAYKPTETFRLGGSMINFRREKWR